jgi:methylthioribose-1-phosphate isomerase
MLALAAKDNAVEFYAVVPTSTIDLNTATGADIPIEERDPAEVLDLEKDGRPIAPPESRARNPAFDITPHRLVTAIVTEVGVLKPPYTESLRLAVEKAQST